MLSLEQFEECFPRISDRNVQRYYRPMYNAMQEFSINLPERIAAFFAQIGHESADLYYVSEIASGHAYDNRKDLGNTTTEAINIVKGLGTTAGCFWKGHGFIQITGFYNHKKCAEALKIDCLKNPMLLTEPRDACRSSAWFFNSHGLNSLADKGQIDTISKIINGGYNGFIDRRERYKKCLKVLCG